MQNPLSDMADWVTRVVESLGYLGIALLVALENLVPPIPSEVILPLAGFLVGQGRFSFIPVVLSATGGSVGGALLLYGLGHWLGEERLRQVVRKYGRFVLLDEEDMDNARDKFNTHGRKAVLVGRLLPGVRSLISVPAGLVGMPIWQFVTYTAIGSAIWNVALVSIGWILGREWTRVERYTTYLQYAVIALVFIFVAWFVWKRRGKLRGSR